MALHVPLFIETSLFFMQKAAPRRQIDGTFGLGALLMPRELAGLVQPSVKPHKQQLPPQVEDAMQSFLAGGDAKFVKLCSGPLELEKTRIPNKRRLIELGMKTVAEHIPILDPAAKCVCPAVSTSDHDNKMLYFTRMYGKTPTPLCANGPGGCAAVTLPSAPGPLPIYLSMSEHAAAEKDEEEAKRIFNETAEKSLCLLCYRTESSALACGLSEKLSNSAEELRRHVAIMPPFTNLINVAGGYFDWAIGVNPGKTPQISFSAVVSGRPVQANGDDCLVVHYDRSTDAEGRELGLYINQNAILWRPSLN